MKLYYAVYLNFSNMNPKISKIQMKTLYELYVYIEHKVFILGQSAVF